MADAVADALEWVRAEGCRTPGFAGAYLRGGILEQPLDAPFAAWRDVDLCIVSTDLDVGVRDNVDVPFGRVVIECGFSNLDAYRSAATVLSSEVSSHLRRSDAILADPTGKLSSLQEAIWQEYSKRRWVSARCATQKRSADRNLQLAREGEVIGAVRAFLYITGGVASSRLVNPTSRRCFARMRSLLLELGERVLYEETLEAFGSARLTRTDVESYLRAALDAYDRALQIERPPSPLNLRLHPSLRPYAAEGARELIQEGLHREAMYWIWHFHTIAQVAFEFDLPPVQRRPELWEAYDRLLIALGLETPAAVRAHGQRSAALSDRVFRLVNGIVSGYAD